MQHRSLGILVAIASLAASCSPSTAPLRSLAICLQAPYSSPPADLTAADLAGTWQVHYGERGVDTLVIESDGTFRQLYEDFLVEDYVFETGSSTWRLEPDGRGGVRIRLALARYYLRGIATAEGRKTRVPSAQEDVRSTPAVPIEFPLYDPIAREAVQDVDELVLSVRADSAGDFLLHHMWTNPDRGFLIFGCEEEHFRRVDAP